MAISRSLPAVHYSMARTSLMTIENHSFSKTPSWDKEITLRIRVTELALRTVADIVVHLATATAKAIKSVIEIPLYVLNRSYAPRATLMEASSHLSRSTRSAVALITLFGAFVQPKWACSTYKWLSIGLADKSFFTQVRCIAEKAWQSPYRNRTIMAGAILVGTALGYRYLSGTAPLPAILNPREQGIPGNKTNNRLPSIPNSQEPTNGQSWAYPTVCAIGTVFTLWVTKKMCIDSVRSGESSQSHQEEGTKTEDIDPYANLPDLEDFPDDEDPQLAGSRTAWTPLASSASHVSPPRSSPSASAGPFDHMVSPRSPYYEIYRCDVRDYASPSSTPLNGPPPARKRRKKTGSQRSAAKAAAAD